MNIKEIAQELQEELHPGNTNEENKKIAEKLMKLLEWKFNLKTEYFNRTEEQEKIFGFLKEKNRTCRIYEGHNMMCGVEAPNMDRDFFIKYLENLFFPLNQNHIFEDPKIIIILDHDGGLKIKQK